ncbi:hypothetical protein SFHH103_00628 [Sinorhizobium fredii HH103]|uniref:Uncharacterized protein n=1 Tax=Sinorhizobium fredii (strain HH103) TaxID=1117943 RepID=G9A237_SINF1|nr:hypothetical protein SFHH103_00628 [Sinorhizobium fredii HH103]
MAMPLISDIRARPNLCELVQFPTRRKAAISQNLRSL